MAEEVEIHIKNVKNDTANIYIAVYDDGDDWPAGQPFRTLVADAELDTTKVKIELPVGTYAISVYQDINGNGKMDYNLVRMPKEPWGVSNDAPARFGPPSWKKMKFDVDAATKTMEFSLR